MFSYTIKKIIVPIDLSETSLNALDSAVALAQRHNASLVLLNVVETEFEFLDAGFSSFSVNSNAGDVITALAGGLQHRHMVTPAVVQEEGHVSQTILKAALLHHADLIVMGTHGA